MLPPWKSSRDITLLTKVFTVKAMVFLVVMHRCESWTIKKTECWRIDAFELWCWRRLLRVPWTARHLLTCGVHLSVSYLFAFSYGSWGSRSKNTEVVCHSLLQWTTLCQTSPPWPGHLGWPCTAWLSFTELDKVVVHVARMVIFLWLWFQSVCPLMPSLSAYHLSGLLLPLTWGIASQLLQRCATTACYNKLIQLKNFFF